MAVAGRVAVAKNTGHFSIESLRKLREMMVVEEFDKGSSIYWEAETNEKLYFLLKGKVKLTKINEEGKELTMYCFFSGDMFGEYPSENSYLNSYTAQTMEKSEIGVLRRCDIDKLLKESGELALEFSYWLSQTHRHTQLKLRDLLLYGKSGALASTLIRISNTYGIYEENKVKITKKFTNLELAELIGATRETVNRLLASFKQDGLIQYKKGRIEILDLAGLKEVNQCEECPVEICRL
ncbi:Crp/Fnr family transcriptional regulator [Virgibacillus sp. NKC19-3]|uniref:Crp/Fnr family transcriptional regulator n=1 Tax=Virgibacillus saliphilus TaxID=2831674 RepID=UPI001C9B9945|nr:Crp/Fnr family transcriptional regulator [Virgibacillus sp. NKC19-3]MBY7142037.1 Crp/Fnr family transcriptional regulator [Virgibacillus sp. NKC19-3]